MANNCADGVYNLQFTDNTKNPIVVNKQTLIQNVLDITLLGKSRKEYGEVFDENMLHMLENFACPEDANNPNFPDFNQVYADALKHPTEGQLWWNSSRKTLYVYDGARWIANSTLSDVAGNSGILAHGQSLPRPISAVTGYEFGYDECSWIVSPFNFPDEIDYMTCYTDSQAKVTAQYRMGQFTVISDGYAFYQIIGIKFNDNEGADTSTPLPIPSPTPTPTNLPMPSLSVGASPSPTFTPTATTGLTVTPTPTGTPTPSPTPSVSRTGTPVVTTTPTPTASVTPSPTPSITPSKTIAPLRATLYISPSKGFPSGSNTEIPSPCSTTNTSNVACLNVMSVVLQEISGGTAPYSVDFSNVNFGSSLVDTSTGTTISTTTTRTYAGASGSSTSTLRTGADSTSSLSATAKIGVTGAFDNCHNGQWSLSVASASFVTITDALGKVLTLYTPSGLQGNVFGTNYTTPQGTYTDSWFSTANCTQSISAPDTTASADSTDACVTIDSVFPNGSLAKDTKVGEEMLTSDPYNYFDAELSDVSYSTTKLQPCVRIVTESGASLVCSVTAPIPTYDNGYMMAPDLLNRTVPVMRNNITNWEIVIIVENVGDREVQHITVGDRCFWAGETADAFILHHNKTSTDA